MVYDALYPRRYVYSENNRTRYVIYEYWKIGIIIFKNIINMWLLLC